MKTFIIAEAGVNHNGNIKIAKKLIDTAKEAGADAIKFQTFDAEKLVTREAPKAKYQSENVDNSSTQLEMLKKLQLTAAATQRLFDYSKQKSITFISTPFDEDSADLLGNLGVDIYKIGSGELTNRRLIEHIAKKRKTIILSTGMSYLGEIERALRWIGESGGLKRTKKIPGGGIFQYPLVLLHCVSSYPCPYSEANLRAIETIRVAFNVPVGFSDHTPGIEASVAAVALGAAVIEKHMTLDRNMEGPDHKASLEPSEFIKLVKSIRNTELSMGDGVKRPAKCEEDIRRTGRRSIVAKRKIYKDSVITLDDVDIKRPGTGIQAEFIDMVLGMRARTDINADRLIGWKDLEYPEEG